MKTICAILVALFLSPPVAAGAAELDTVLAKAKQRIEATDFRATGRLVDISGSGSRTNYKVAMKAHWFADGLRLWCEIVDSSNAHVRLLLQMDAHGRTAIQIARPDAAHPKHFVVSALPFEKWSDAIMNTGFSVDDLVESQFFWKSQEMLPPSKYGARDCFVLKSEPSASDKTHYSSVTSYLDRQIYFPVYVVKAMRGTAVKKDYVYYGLRQTSGVWSASQIEVKTEGKPGSALLIIERGSAKANLSLKDFDLTPAADQ